ncbi:hypothetical protein HCN51_26150 [Nonomuraea sp. FMUSA5-5]|uniref:Membrane lipoprotein n=1 Tax=Nonomuraea composti TaxID=2720023 RepID=A0ABX1BDF5_9ACTN|nr:hypothetical protein [Nonomuraea sp. FMUSA5-5]NJP92893.1 hypothetical protein [Nonomuraea sp. FMUSA5-5]
MTGKEHGGGRPPAGYQDPEPAGLASRSLATLVAAALVVAGCGSGAALSQEVIDRARTQGVAPELMYVVDLPGFELAEQSVGGVGEDGFGAVYTGPGGEQVELRVDRTPYECVGTCERDDGGGWYTVHEGRQAYVAVRKDHYVKLVCPVGQVDRAVLKRAAEGARPAVGDGGTPAPPPSLVRRGDLPENGDGAPIQRTGPGG